MEQTDLCAESATTTASTSWTPGSSIGDFIYTSTNDNALTINNAIGSNNSIGSIGGNPLGGNPLIPGSGTTWIDPNTHSIWQYNSTHNNIDIRIGPNFGAEDPDLLEVLDNGDEDSKLGFNYSDFEMLAALVDMIKDLDSTDPLRVAIDDKLNLMRTERALKKINKGA